MPHDQFPFNISETNFKNVSTLNDCCTYTTVPSYISNSSVAFNMSDSIESFTVTFLLSVFSLTVSAIGVPTCILIISTIANFRELRTYQNAFVASLALRDMMILGVILPLFYVDLILGFYPFGKRACIIQLMFSFCFGLGSVLELTSIAISRYVKICCHIGTYRYVYTKRNTVLFITLTWSLSFLAGVPVSLMHGTLNNTTQVCFIQKSPPKAFVVSFILVAAVITTSYCYLNIWRTVRKARENLKRFNEGPTRHRTVNHNFQSFVRDCMVFIVYLFLLLPFVLLNSFGLSSPRDFAWDLAKMLSYTNNLTNSVIYGLLNKQIRIRFSRLLRCGKHNRRSNAVGPYSVSITGSSRRAPSAGSKKQRDLSVYTVGVGHGENKNNNNDNNSDINGRNQSAI